MEYLLAQVNNSCGAYDNLATIIYASVGGTSVFVCLMAIILVFASGLYTQLIYRLALYQASSSLAFGLSCVLQLTYKYYNDDVNIYSKVCVSLGWFTQFTCSLKLLFSMWMTSHLFLYAVCYRNVKKLEPWFAAGIVVLSFLVSSVPFATHSYGPSGSWCWIENLGGNSCSIQLAGVVEQFALWYGLALVVLLAQCAAIVVMICVVMVRVYRIKRYHLLSSGSTRQYYNLLKQLFPLVSYPLLFTLLITPPFFNRVYEAFRHSGNRGLLLANACIAPAWSLSAGITLIAHVSIVLCCTRVSRSERTSVETEGSVTVGATSSCSSTYFVIPSEDNASLSA